jgi:diguanylate cyclase (GGDEF)-like protein
MARKMHCWKPTTDIDGWDMSRLRRRILIADHEASAQRLLARVVGRHHDVVIAASGNHAMGVIASERNLDVALIRSDLPGCGREALLGQLRRSDPSPTVILSGGPREARFLLEAVNQGEADRAILRPYLPAEVLSVVRQALDQRDLLEERSRLSRDLRQRDVSLAALTGILEHRFDARTRELCRTNQALERALAASEHLAQTDVLTGIPNRRHLEEIGIIELKRASRTGLSLSLLIVDVDRFKETNDRHGHAVGDGVLRSVATCIRGELRQMDTVARYGGDEFVVLLPSTCEREATLLADRLRLAVSDLHGGFSDCTGRPAVQVSLGVASSLPGGADTLGQMVERADLRLYQAKSQGRNCVVGGRVLPPARA